MTIVQQIVFILVAAAAIGLFTRNAIRIRRNILLGRDEAFDDQPGLRWKNLLLLAFGQKKMFRNPLVALMHFVIYAGFIIINLEALEIGLDGIFGTHRLFAGPLGPLYDWLINAFEFLAVFGKRIVRPLRRRVLCTGRGQRQSANQRKDHQ